MSTAEQLVPLETGPLSWAEICRRYPDQYVCLVDIVHPALRSPEITSARVVGHGAIDDDAFAPIRDLGSQYPHFAIRFTGESKIPYLRPSFILDDEDLDPFHP